MNIAEAGVMPKSKRYFFTPSSFAERMLYYPTRVGHFFCDERYRFSYQSDIAKQAGHHLNYMLFLIKQGQLDITIDGASYAATPRQAVLFDCKKPHEYKAAGNFEFYWLIFNGGQSELFFNELLEKHGGRHVWDTPDAADLQDTMTQLLASCETDRRLPEHRYSELIYQALCRLLVADEAQADGWDSLIGQAIAYMDQYYQTEISVQEVAARFHVSGSYFSKRFRARTGCSPYEYLVLRRIDRAKVLLAATDKTVGQIAFETGYNSEENFIRSFKKKVGLAPSAFRQYPI